MDTFKLENIFDIACEEEWSVSHDGERSISSETWNKYLSLLKTKDKIIVTSIRENTTYISWSQLVRDLYKNFNKFSREIGDDCFYVYTTIHLSSDTLLT